MKLLALKGMRIDRTRIDETRFCGTYVTSYPLLNTPEGYIIDSLETKKIIDYDEFTNQFSTPPLITKHFKKIPMPEYNLQNALAKVNEAELLVYGEGDSYIEALKDMFSKVSFQPFIPGVLNKSPEEIEEFYKYNGYKHLDVTTQSIFDYIIKRCNILESWSLYNIHKKDMYQKTYITYDSLRTLPALNSVTEEKLLCSLRLLYRLNFIYFIDAVPKHEVRYNGQMDAILLEDSQIDHSYAKISNRSEVTP